MQLTTILAALAFTTSVFGAPAKPGQPGSQGLARRPITKPALQKAFVALKSDFEAQGTALKTALAQVDQTDAAQVAAAAAPVLKSIDASLKKTQQDLALGGDKAKRQLENIDIDAIAEDIADAVKALLTALGPIQDLLEQLPILGTLLGPFLTPISLDLAIVLGGVGIVLTGVLALVSDLLSALGGALSGLGLTSVSGLLGL